MASLLSSLDDNIKVFIHHQYEWHEEIYSSLNKAKKVETDYKHAKEVWKSFK